MIEKKVLQPLHSFDPSTSKLSETQRPLNVETGGGGVMKAHTPTPPSMPSTGSSSNIARLSSIKMSSENGVKLSLSHRQLPKLEPVLKGTSAGSYSQPSSPVDSHHHAPIFNIPTSAPAPPTLSPATITTPANVNIVSVSPAANKKSFFGNFRMPSSNSSNTLSSSTTNLEFGGIKQRKSTKNKTVDAAAMRGTKSHNALPLGLDDDSSDKLNTETEKSPPMSTQGSEQQLPDDYVATAKDNSSTTTTATANGGSGGGASSSSAASRPNSALKTKSLPKISAIFKKSSPTSSGAGSNNNAHHQIASSANALNVVNAKNRSISASPNTTGGGSGASSATVTTMAGSMATLSIATPLNQASKMACLSAYEMHTPLTQKSYTLDDFMVVKRVGKGGFASVYLTRLKASTGRYWALKVVKKADVVRLKQEKQILNEKNILKGIQHAFIVELVQTFQDPQHLYMVLEYVAGGDLFTYLRKVQRFPEDDARFYVSEVLVALEYLHAHDIVYRDLKPENILLDTTGHIKVADFGFAKVVKNVTCSFCGTPDYIAAEIVIGKPYTKAVDWWSLGVLIFELTSGKTPFGDDSSERVYENIQVGKIKWHALLKGPVKEIIAQLLVLNVTERLGSGATGGAAAIKAHPYFAKINWGKLEARQVTPPYTPNVLAPEIIEKERAQKVTKDEVLDNIQKNNQASNGNWLGNGGYGDLFKNF